MPYNMHLHHQSHQQSQSHSSLERRNKVKQETSCSIEEALEDSVDQSKQLINPLQDFSSAFSHKQKNCAKFNRALKFFCVLAPSLGVLSLTLLLLSMVTTDWLRTEEKMPNKNRTILFGPNKSPEYLPKLTYSGLFRLCSTKPGGLTYTCFLINYFPKEQYQPDQHDSTLAIAYVVINSAWFFITSLCLSSFAQILGCVGQCTKKRKVFTFISGVTFIISGLLLFIGQVVYISLLKGEVGSKLDPVSMLSPPRFTYMYGWSTFLLIASFLVTESAGVAAIFYFIQHHQYKFICKQSLKDNYSQSLTKGVANGDVIRHKSALNLPLSQQPQTGRHQEKSHNKQVKQNGKIVGGHSSSLFQAQVSKKKEEIEDEHFCPKHSKKGPKQHHNKNTYNNNGENGSNTSSSKMKKVSESLLSSMSEEDLGGNNGKVYQVNSQIDALPLVEPSSSYHHSSVGGFNQEHFPSMQDTAEDIYPENGLHRFPHHQQHSLPQPKQLTPLSINEELVLHPNFDFSNCYGSYYPPRGGECSHCGFVLQPFYSSSEALPEMNPNFSHQQQTSGRHKRRRKGNKNQR